MKKLKVGLLIDPGPQNQQIIELVKLASKSGLYELTIIYQNFDKDKNSNSYIKRLIQYIKRRGFRTLMRSFMFKALVLVERIIIAKNLGFTDFFKREFLDHQNLNVINANPKVSASGLLVEYEDLDIKKIKNENLDLLVRGGSGILRGEILTVCDLGVISFHHGDNNINRGGPPGFWEVYLKQDRTGFVIQRLSEELDGGEVIYRGWIATRPYYTENLMRIKRKSNIFMHKTIEKLAADKKNIQVSQKIPYSGPLYKVPFIRQQIWYFCQLIMRIASKLYKKLLKKRYEWFVGYQFSKDWNDVSLRRFQLIPNPKNRFLADPFVIKRKDAHYLFVEDFDYKFDKGCISVFKVTNDGHSFLGVALEEDFHLSYPFIFEHNTNLYMCPETHKSRDIRIYECIEFPLKWKLKSILIKDICAADTNIVKHGDYWYLFTNSDSADMADHSSELNIYYSKDLFSTNWISHPQNPVIFDSNVARNGGLIYHDKNIYRVFQRQGFDMYGKKFGVSKVTELNTFSYQEIELWDVSPQLIDDILGAHTYNFDSGMAVTDFVKIS